MTLTTVLSVTALLSVFLGFGHLLLKENCLIERHRQMVQEVTKSLHIDHHVFHIIKKRNCGASYSIKNTNKEVILEYDNKKTRFKKIL